MPSTWCRNSSVRAANSSAVICCLRCALVRVNLIMPNHIMGFIATYTGSISYHLAPKVGVQRAIVVVVLEKLAKHQDINGHGVLRVVIVVEIGVAIFVAKPVDNQAVERAEEPMQRQQQELPPSCGKKCIKATNKPAHKIREKRDSMNCSTLPQVGYPPLNLSSTSTT